MSGVDTEGGRRVLQDKEILFTEGQSWDGLYKVESGEIEIYRERDGKQVIFCVEPAGRLIGTATLLSRQPRMASARAKGESVVLHLEQQPAELLLKNMPCWGRAIIKDLLHHLSTTDENLVDSSLRARNVPSPDSLPIVPVQKFLEGLCWTQGYRPAILGGKEVQVVPLGDLGKWLAPVLQTTPDKVRAAVNALEATRMIRVTEIEKLGPCLLKTGG